MASRSLTETMINAVREWFILYHPVQPINIVLNAHLFDVKEFSEKVNPLGQLVINISPAAVRRFIYNDTGFTFNTNLQGQRIELDVPYAAVLGVLVSLFTTTPVFFEIPNPERMIEMLSRLQAKPIAPDPYAVHEVEPTPPTESFSHYAPNQVTPPATKFKGVPTLRIIKGRK